MDCSALCSFAHAGTRRYKLNVWDVGGQQTIRSYWRNYFEQVRLAKLLCKGAGYPWWLRRAQTDGLLWVIDSADKRRLDTCKAELNALLQQEVRCCSRAGADECC